MNPVTVVIPWADSGCPWRKQAMEWTARYWLGLGVPVLHGHDDSSPVNRSKARNAALLVEAEVVFFADADMWVPAEQFWAAVAVAARTDTHTLAYDRHVKLSRQTTQKLYAAEKVAMIGQTIRGMSSGAHAVSSRLLHEVGGYDERFRGWGGEDRSFQFACDTLAGPGETIAGPSFHLFHPRAPEFSRTTPQRKANLELAMRYKAAAGVAARTGVVRALKDPGPPDPDAMRAILCEAGGPLHGVRERVMNDARQIS